MFLTILAKQKKMDEQFFYEQKLSILVLFLSLRIHRVIFIFSFHFFFHVSTSGSNHIFVTGKKDWIKFNTFNLI